ncbi:MAG: radical SAM family heme chaperone HemW [Coriobacteriia bacterium]|nr:radical SAM family heme chaperone HemW [Coriobacteriia bacterium]
MPHDPYKALYIHIPYCVQRCNYCDFATSARDFDSPEIDEYVESLVLDIKKSEELSDIETIYIGGGTPSYIGSKRLTSLLYALSTSMNLSQVKEFTMEANPESLTSGLVKDVFALGVDRISIGVQSFDDDLLYMLGRAHDSARAIEAVDIAKERFKNISIDLMCGIPGQSIATFKKSLQQAIDLDVQHVSIYPLSIEHNTVFYKRWAKGQMPSINEDEQADHMELAEQMLEAAGFVHYEIANFARSSFESKHNLSYWQGKPYLGLGYMATTMTQNAERRMRVTANHVEDDLNPAQMVAEDMMLAARTKAGISMDLYDRATKLIPDTKKKMQHIIDLGLLDVEENALVPTKRGWMCGNDLFLMLLDLA